MSCCERTLYVQEPDAENAAQRNFLPERHIQLDEERQRQQADHKIRDHAEDGDENDIDGLVVTVELALILFKPRRIALQPICIQWPTTDQECDHASHADTADEGYGRVYDP